MVGLPYGKKIEDIFSGVDKILVCDGRTDGQASCDSIVRGMHTRHAVKIIRFWWNLVHNSTLIWNSMTARWPF